MPAAENHLLDLLPRRDRSRLVAASETVQLELGTVLAEPADEARMVYFPTHGFISLVTNLEGEPGLEVGLVGREGMLGAHMALGVAASPLHALVQGEGRVRRIGAAAFRRELAASKPLGRILDRYLYVLMAQLATSCGCTRFHSVGPRLARWLLMSQDRAHADDFHLTQEFLAYMLGVRRVGITGAASDLQRRGLIRYRRGAITVLDRAGLQAAACRCYAADRAIYRRILG